MNRVPYLDGWRGFAIAAVLLGHFVSFEIFDMGKLGVEFFFVLSGRLMAEILFERHTPISTFFKRRVARIYPVLLAYVLAVSALFVAARQSYRLLDSLAAGLLVFNYYQLAHPIEGISYLFGHIWSLCVEEHMYILLAAIALLHRRFGLPAKAAIAVLAVAFAVNGVAQTFEGLDYYHVYWRSDVRGASILFGALAYLNKGELRKIPVQPILVLAVALLLNLNGAPDYIKYTFGSALLAVSLCLIQPETKSLTRPLSTGPLMAIGIWSYSIYLTQQPFFVLNSWLRNHVPYGFLLGPILIGFSVGAGWVVYRLVETPLRKLLSKRSTHVTEIAAAS